MPIYPEIKKNKGIGKLKNHEVKGRVVAVFE